MKLFIPDANTGGESSSSSATQATGASDAKHPAQSSSTEQIPDAKPESLQDVVSKFKADLAAKDKDKTTEVTTSESSPEKVEDKSIVLKENDTDKAPIKTEVKDEELPFHKHPRFQEILKQKAEAQAEVEQYKGAAQRMTQVETYCQQNNVTPQEYDNGLRMIALMKTNLPEFVKRAEAMVATAKIHLGEALPADLQKEVDDGRIAVEHAKTMAQLRLDKELQKQNQDRQTATNQQRQATDVQTAINGWATTLQKSDASFKPKVNGGPDGKFELVNAKFMELWGAKPPTSVAGVVQLAQEAYDNINAFINQFDKKPATRRSPNPNTSVRSNEQPIDTSKPGWAKEVAKRRMAERNA